MRKTRVGVIGIGHLGNYHLQKYSRIAECEVVGIVEVLPEKLAAAAQKHQCRGVTDHREILADVEAVSICVPTAGHYFLARDFLEAGVHVLLEKPVTVTLAEADELIYLARRKKLVLQVGMIERFNPAIMALDRFHIHPLFIEAHRLHPFQVRGLDINVVLDLMIHDLDIILKYVKSPVLSVDAAGVAVLSDHTDIANARIHFASGCIANVTASRLSVKKMQKIRFFEPGGYHSVDYQARHLESLGFRQSPDGTREIIQNPTEISSHDPLEAEIRSFLTAVRERREPMVTGEDGREALALALKIMENMKTTREEPGP